MNADLKKIVSKVKDAQNRLQLVLDKQDWPGYMDEARKYAEKQGSEVKKLLSSDLGKVRSFIERERKELERFQKQIPGEVKKLRGLVKSQTKDFEKFLNTLRKSGAAAKKSKSKKTTTSTKKKTTSKKASAASS